jgi:hypothetical protein
MIRPRIRTQASVSQGCFVVFPFCGGQIAKFEGLWDLRGVGAEARDGHGADAGGHRDGEGSVRISFRVRDGHGGAAAAGGGYDDDGGDDDDDMMMMMMMMIMMMIRTPRFPAWW